MFLDSLILFANYPVYTSERAPIAWQCEISSDIFSKVSLRWKQKCGILGKREVRTRNIDKGGYLRREKMRKSEEKEKMKDRGF